MALRRRIPKRELTLTEKILEKASQARSVLVALVLVVLVGLLVESLTSDPEAPRKVVPGPATAAPTAPSDGYELLTTSWSVDAPPAADPEAGSDEGAFLDDNSPLAQEKKRQEQLAEEARERWQNLDIAVRRQ